MDAMKRLATAAFCELVLPMPLVDRCDCCGRLTDEQYLVKCERCHLMTCGDCLGEFNACKTCLKEERDAARMPS